MRDALAFTPNGVVFLPSRAGPVRLVAVLRLRRDAGHTGYFVLDAPATPERLRLLCADGIAAEYAPADFRAKISC